MTPTHPKASWATSVISGVQTFPELEARIAALPVAKDRGDAFEVFVEAYLATQAIAQAETVWASDTTPVDIRKKLNLPASDYGADGVYRDRSGNMVIYQAKFRTGRPSLSWRELSTFFGIAEKADRLVLFTNTDAIAKVAEERTGFHTFRGSDFERLEPDDFERMAEWLQSGVIAPSTRGPRPHQREALDHIQSGLEDNDRATVIMACGTGKTLISLWAAEQVSPKRVLVLLPSLALLRQTLHEWARFTSLGDQFNYLCVCSDPTVSRGIDVLVTRPEDNDFPVSTDAEEVKRFLSQDTDGVQVVFSTYQSAQVVAAGVGKNVSFDVGIFDEAHKTAGRKGSKFGFALSDENIRISKRLFFTATPRHYDIRKKDKEGEASLVFSMDNEEVYGPVVHKLTFAEAAKRDIICNYKVVVSVVNGKMVNDELLSHGEVLVEDDHVRARQVAVQLALARAVDELGVGRIITFHTNVKTAAGFVAEGAEGVQNHLTGFSTFHVNGTQRTAHREDQLRAFAEADKGLITNARCLTEGVDVPAVDMVAFVAPRRSKIDIVQATGRAMRKAGPDKEYGYILLPLFLEQDEGEALEEALERSQFDEVAAVLNAMQEQDAELAEIIRQLKQDKGRLGGVNPSRLADKLVTLGREIGLSALQQAISAKLVDKLGVSWDEAYGELRAYREHEGDCRVWKSFKTDSGYKLGQWVGVQRTNHDKLTPERLKLLDDLGFVWNEIAAKWNEGYGLLKAFYAQEGHCRVPGGHKSDSGYGLGDWVDRQRTLRDPLTTERRQLLEELGFDWDPRVTKWNEGYEFLKAFYAHEGHCRVPGGHKSDSGYRLGSWVTKLRTNHDRLTPERLKLLDDLGFDWDPLATRWNEGYEHLKAYRKREGHIRVHNMLKTDGGYRLGGWVITQRTNHDRLTPERRKLLDDLGFDWDRYTTQWNEGYEHLKAYRKREGHIRVLAMLKTDSGYALGNWFKHQRKTRDQLTPERFKLLDDLGFDWDPLATRWDEGYELLKAFYAHEGHCRVPGGHKSDSGYRLGNWVSTQRIYREQLTPERRKLLEDLGFEWVLLTHTWKDSYRHLKAYHEFVGHCRVPARFKTDSGYSLGKWVHRQRGDSDLLTPERRKLLDDLGFEWPVK
jgi:superfamily II DNA or RNA helicase